MRLWLERQLAASPDYVLVSSGDLATTPYERALRLRTDYRLEERFHGTMFWKASVRSSSTSSCIRGRGRQKKRPSSLLEGLCKFYPGGVLLSHAVARAVSLAMRGLTAVFGMGTGVTLSL